MYEFFRASPIYHHSQCFNEDRFENGRMKVIYPIGFEKDKTTPQEMRNVLREAVDYFCNHITVNVQMLERTKNLK